MINSLDVNETITESGNSVTYDTAGYGQISFTAALSDVSGSSPTFQVELQASDDGVNFNVVHDTRQMSGTDVQRISGIRISSRYYRYAWFVGGSTPSAFLKVTSTLKDYSPIRTGSMFRYNDLNVKTVDATSTVYSSFSNETAGVMMVRPTDTSTAATLKIQGSNDGANWHDHTGEFTISSNQAVNKEFSGSTHRFFRVYVVSAATGGSSATLHCLWNSTGGA